MSRRNGSKSFAEEWSGNRSMLRTFLYCDRLSYTAAADGNDLHGYMYFLHSLDFLFSWFVGSLEMRTLFARWRSLFVSQDRRYGYLGGSLRGKGRWNDR